MAHRPGPRAIVSRIAIDGRGEVPRSPWSCYGGAEPRRHRGHPDGKEIEVDDGRRRGE